MKWIKASEPPKQDGDSLKSRNVLLWATHKKGKHATWIEGSYNYYDNAFQAHDNNWFGKCTVSHWMDIEEPESEAQDA